MSPRGVPKGEGVPGLYPSDAPRTEGGSTMDHQYGPDASIFVDASKKCLKFLARKPLLSGPQQMPQSVLPLCLPSWQQATSWSPCCVQKNGEHQDMQALQPRAYIIHASTKHRTMRGWTRVMLHWVEDIPSLYISLTPQGIIPIILLDSYQCHIMASVVNLIQDLGCEVVHIPGGCTGLVQPLDVSYNKPFKTRIRATWEE